MNRPEGAPKYKKTMLKAPGKIQKASRNFFHFCILRSGKEPVQVYKRAGWSRQTYQSFMTRDRASSPKFYRTFRQALGWDKCRFYTELMNYYDYEPDPEWKVRVIPRPKKKRVPDES